MDITPGKEYAVYGIRKNMGYTFYLVLTDEVHNDLPWWMPAVLYGNPDGDVPETWQTKRSGYGRWADEEIAPGAYFGMWNDIVDKTEKGYEAFEKIKRES